MSRTYNFFQYVLGEFYVSTYNSRWKFSFGELVGFLPNCTILGEEQMVYVQYDPIPA
jgi:hypothetical protein